MKIRWVFAQMLLTLALVLALGCGSDGDESGTDLVDKPKDGDATGGDGASGASDATGSGGSNDAAGGTAGGAAPADSGDTAADGSGAGQDALPADLKDITGPVSLRGLCDLNTDYPGDEACLLPPPEGMGMQIHIGPEDYDNPGEYLFPAGNESSECVNFTTPNGEDIYYQVFELSGRSGTHHIINTMYISPNAGADGVFSACRDFGTGSNAEIFDNLPGAAKPWMPLGEVAPENANLGRRIPANTASQADMHYFNPSDGPMLREFWLNIWFADKDKITDEANQIRGMGGVVSWIFGIQPGTDTAYDFSCPINAPGRIIALLGHMHSHGFRFTAWLNRGRPNERKVYEVFDYLEPIAYPYDSVTTNPEFGEGIPGAVSGVLDVNAGDTLDWECHVVNDLDVPLRYTNEVVAGEMCNMWGQSVGVKIDCPAL
ncbi:MAG: hypothetical protein OEZ06_22570 [Myxococcales bacterium]|nr:hypothetical protein [Myxococcales bacterium]